MKDVTGKKSVLTPLKSHKGAPYSSLKCSKDFYFGNANLHTKKIERGLRM